jgi:hypothetical protein
MPSALRTNLLLPWKLSGGRKANDIKLYGALRMPLVAEHVSRQRHHQLNIHYNSTRHRHQMLSSST